MGRKKIFTEEEQRKKKNKLMLEKEWYCDVCNNNKNYSLAGKTLHLRAQKHALYKRIREAENKNL